MNRRLQPSGLVPAALVLATLAIASGLALRPAVSHETPAGAVMPEYDDDGRLLLPDDWRRWVLVGASLGLSYSEGSGGSEMFHETLLEPTAYEHFVRTGEFRDGAMLALLLHGTGEGVLPQRRGRFATEVAALEMAVKDSRAEDLWSYYGFGGRNGMRTSATAIDSGSCNDCHREHAAHDNVFVQFYPLLTGVAPAGTVFTSSAGAETRLAAAGAEPATPGGPPLALEGLDPVLLVDGHAELGKPEIVMAHDGFTYQFVSEPTRARFAADPDRFSLQNASCPVIPGAAIDPALFAIYQGRLYAFASQGCVDRFEADPERYLAAAGG